MTEHMHAKMLLYNVQTTKLNKPWTESDRMGMKWTRDREMEIQNE